MTFAKLNDCSLHRIRHTSRHIARYHYLFNKICKIVQYIKYAVGIGLLEVSCFPLNRVYLLRIFQTQFFSYHVLAFAIRRRASFLQHETSNKAHAMFSKAP